MKIAITCFYIFVLLVALWLAEKSNTKKELPWLDDFANPVMSFTESPDSEATEVGFTYRQNPQREGIFRNETLSLKLVKDWETEPINFDVHGASKASPAVDETGVYIGGDTGWFYRFSLDGKLVWRFRTDRNGLGIHGTALLDRDFVYFGAYNGLFYCLHKENGRVAWVAKLGDAVGSSPVADKDFIYISAETALPGSHISGQAMYRFPLRNGRLFKLNRRNGTVIWRTAWVGEQIHSSPTLFDQGRKIGVGANNGFYFSYDTLDGRELWRTQTDGAIKGTAVAYKEKLFFGTYARNLVALNAQDGHIVWTVPLSGISQNSPALIPDLDLLVTGAHENGEWISVRASDGRVIWRMPSGHPLSRSSPIAVRETPKGPWNIWMTCQGNFLCAVRANNGTIVGRWPLTRVFTGSPAVLNGDLYIALNDGGLLKFSTRP